MKAISHIRLYVLAAFIVALGGCLAGGGIGGTGISIGTITGFGSVIMNGVEFNTDAALITVDDSPASQSDLRVGMVIGVDGEVASNGVDGKAFGINYDSNLEGPISDTPVTGADPRQKQFTLLGVTVAVNELTTTLDGGASFASLALNDFVEVSGFYDANGDLQASYLKKVATIFVADDSIVEARGVVTSYNGSDLFLLNISAGSSLTIHVSGSTSLVAVPDGQITNGQLVEVAGTLPAVNSQSLTATRIEYEDIAGDIDEIEVEGIVTGYVSNGQFNVSGIAVDASTAEFEPPSLATNLADNIKVEVEGSRVDGVLIAEAVKQRGRELHFEATVGTVSPGLNQLELSYIPGNITIHTNSTTLMEDEVFSVSPFTLADIGGGDALRVQAYLDGSGNVVASEIRRVLPDNDIIHAPLQSKVADISVTVLGITFTTNGATTFKLADNSVTDSATFYSTVNIGDLINLNDNTAADGVADELKIK